jgi:Hint module
LLLHDGTTSVITHIQDVYSPGVYAPFTDSGKLVVDGILVSSYIDFMPDKIPHWLSQHFVAHLLQAPH